MVSDAYIWALVLYIASLIIAFSSVNPIAVFAKLADKWLLRRMTRVLKLRLTEKQRAMILNPKPPDTTQWGRRSGKTLVAVLWMFIHCRNAITRSSLPAFYHDPDVYNREALSLCRDLSNDTYDALSYHYHLETKMYYRAPFRRGTLAISIQREAWAWRNIKGIYDELVSKGVRPRCTLHFEKGSACFEQADDHREPDARP